MIEIDHVLWAAEDLDEGVASLVARTGFEPVGGGVHPGWGTRNALVGLGTAYLEVLATDPAQDGGWLAEEVLALPRPTLHRWALRTDDLDAVVARLADAGLRAEPRAMSRTTPTGDVLRWRIAFVEGHDLGRAVPFVLDWLDTPHPAATLAPQGRLDAVVVAHPRPQALAGLLDLLGIAVDVRREPAASIEVALDAPLGAVVLGGADDRP